MSNEAVSIPPNLAAEMTAYDPTSGELRTHYAGFFDPGFGFDPTGGFRGSRAALEVRAHDVPVHGRERPGRVQAHLRAHARGADLALRLGHRVVVPAAGGDAEPVLQALARRGSRISARRHLCAAVGAATDLQRPAPIAATNRVADGSVAPAS